MLTVPPPFVYNTTATIPNVCTSILPVAQDKWGSTCRPNYSGWQPVAAVIILVLAGLNLVKEAFQLFSQRLSYFRSTTNIIEMALYILSILVVINVNDFSRATGMREPWQWQCGAAALFFSWLGLLLFIQNFPRFGIFVLMFNDVLWTFASFFAVFVLFILGFALSFYVLLMNQVAFSQWWKSIIKTSVMMIGEFEYDGIFNSVPTMVSYQAVTYTLFVVFMIIMSIIIMNLLVGLAVDDIKGVQDNAELERLAMQVKLALEVEFTLPQIFRRRFIRQSRSFFPNLHRRKHWIVRWFHSEEHLNHRTIHDALNPEKSDLQLIDTKVETMGRKLGDLRSMVHDMQERNKGLESMLKAIATNLNVKWEENNDDD
uniref:Transient receptor potential cation channel subfamily A member 1 homolog n=2 Tax=Ciona intestinalis TaxID=7719 RepID=F6UJR3_CIOIN